MPDSLPQMPSPRVRRSSLPVIILSTILLTHLTGTSAAEPARQRLRSSRHPANPRSPKHLILSVANHHRPHLQTRPTPGRKLEIPRRRCAQRPIPYLRRCLVANHPSPLQKQHHRRNLASRRGRSSKTPEWVRPHRIPPVDRRFPQRGRSRFLQRRAGRSGRRNGATNALHVRETRRQGTGSREDSQNRPPQKHPRPFAFASTSPRPVRTPRIFTPNSSPPRF